MIPETGALKRHTRPDDLRWMNDAACKGQPAELFYLTTTTLEGRAQVRATVDEFCAVCPVKSECRNYGRRYREQGIWGGIDRDRHR